MHTRKTLAIVIGLFLTAVLVGQDSAEKFKAEATEGAAAWLKHLDKGMYDETWTSSASLVKKAVTRDQWVQSMESARRMFGDLVGRQLKSANYVTTLPGAPDGHYVVFEYKTEFENKKSAVETLTVMKDSDGQWRVSGYYIK
jgi:hypothetical protein